MIERFKRSQILLAILSSNLDKKVEFSVDIKTLSSTERLQKALKKWAFFFFLMVISVPIPAAHLLLVPSFFCLAVYSFFSTLKKPYLILVGEIPCPNCQTKQKAPKVSFNWPLKVICPQCQLQIRVEPRFREQPSS